MKWLKVKVLSSKPQYTKKKKDISEVNFDFLKDQVITGT
jgi:hypothetical protein